MSMSKVLIGLVAAFCLGGAAPAVAPPGVETVRHEAQDPDDLALRRERATRLVAMMDVDDAVQSVIAVMPELLEPTFANLPPAERAEALAIMKEVMAVVFPDMFDELMTASIDVYATRFTLEELDAMIAFYETDVGRSIMRKSAAAGAEIGAISQQLMPRYALRALEEICARTKCPRDPASTRGK
jgi:hypothetical protein